MKPIFTFLLILFLTFSGYHLTFRRLRLPLYARPFYVTGSEFLFLGLLLGPSFLNILDSQAQKDLFFLHAFLLGWIGLIFGFQFELSKLGRFPAGLVGAAVIEGALSFLLIFVGIHLAVGLMPALHHVVHVGEEMMLAAVGACTAQTGVALMASQQGPKFGKLSQFLRCISSIGPLAPFISFGLFLSFGNSTVGNFPHVGGFANCVLILFGSCLGVLLLFLVFLRQPRKEGELILLLLSTVAAGGGIASALGVSPLFFMFVLGVLLVNLLREKERLYQLLITVEKPAYVLLLVLLGANWRLHSLWIPLFAVVYCAYRALVKTGAAAIATRRVVTEGEGLSALSGMGLLHQGGLALAMLLDFQQTFPGGQTSRVVSLVLFAVLLNDVIGMFFTERLLKKGAS